jgi:hypothetical protein
MVLSQLVTLTLVAVDQVDPMVLTAVILVVLVEHMVLVEVEVRMEVILEVLVLVVQYALSGQVMLDLSHLL